MTLHKSEVLEVLFNEIQHQLVLQCQGDLSAIECKAGFMKALRSARDHQVKNWLLDFREVVTMPEESQVWIQVQVFPQIMAYLGPDNYVALVVSESCYQDMLVNYGQEGLQTYNSFIILNVFSAADLAAAWLASHNTTGR